MTIRVGGTGPKDASMAFVGEALGIEETLKKEPLVGKAGREFNSWLTVAGIIRALVYITNVVKEQPVKNDIGTFVNLKKPSKKHPIESAPRYDEWLKYVEELRVEIEGLSANVIVALGNTALYALTGRRGIEANRGSILESTLVPGRKVIPTFHPSTVNRGTPINRYYGIQDLIRAKGDSAFPELRLPERDIVYDLPFNRVIAALDNFLADPPPLLSCDTESIRDEISHVGLSDWSELAIVIPFITPEWEQIWIEEEETAIWLKLNEVLSTIPIMAQNANYDAFLLWRKYGIIANIQEDTGIIYHLTFPGMRKRLETLCSLFTREPYYKSEGRQAINRGKWDHAGFCIYNGKDTAVLHDIHPKVMTGLKRMRNEELYRKTMRLHGPIMYMQARGIRIDMEMRKALSKEYRIKEEEACRKITEEVGYELNPHSSPQCQHYFYEEKGHKPYKKDGKDTTDDDALVRLIVKGESAAQHVLDARRARKARSTFVDFHMDPDHRLRSSMNSAGTVSGRLSSSKFLWGTGMNQQNYPLPIRAMWMADEGYVAYKLDLAGADSRVVVYLANEKALIDAYENRKDVHSMTASMIIGKPAEQISREKGSASTGGPNDSERDIGKTANHALNYDMGYFTASLAWEVSVAEAKRRINIYHNGYRNIRGVFHRDVQAQLHDNRILTSVMGRHRKFLGSLDRELYKEGYNWMGQSPVADIINWWGLLYTHENQQWFKHLELLNQIHDEVDFQIPLEVGWIRHAEMILRIRDSLQQTIKWKGRQFYIPAELEMGYRFYPMQEVDIYDITSAVKLGVMLKEAWVAIKDDEEARRGAAA